MGRLVRKGFIRKVPVDVKEVWCEPFTYMTGAGEGGGEEAAIASQAEGLQAQKP